MVTDNWFGLELGRILLVQKYTDNKINSAENYAWYLDCKHSALGEINSTRMCAFPIEAY